ncbi:MAG: hypothetical protein V4598_10015 [Bdellovibrionota bacterium]
MRILISLILTLTLILPAVAQTPPPVDPLLTETDLFLNNPEAERSGGMANSLLIMSLASLGSVMLTTCAPVTAGNPLPPSLVIFSTAAAAYVLAEVTAARAHKADIALRETAINALADNLRRRGGGDVQRITFAETKRELEYLRAFVDMRRTWLMSAAIGFFAAAAEAQNEASAGTTDFDINCIGTLGAAFPVATELGIAFSTDGGPAENIAGYIGGVLPIVSNQILPLMQTPDGRSIVANIAASTSSIVVSELSGLSSGIEANIGKTDVAIEAFDTENGVAADTGLAIAPPEAPTNPSGEGRDAGAPANPSLASATASASGEGAVSASNATSAAANVTTLTCAEKNEAKKSLNIKSSCTNPVKFPVVKMRTNIPAMKSAVEATTKFANALAAGNIKEANISSATINALAAKILEVKDANLKKSNLTRLKRGKPMQNLDGETKKLIATMNAEIKTSVTQSGGAKLLASTLTVPASAAIKPEPKKDAPEMVRDLSPRLRGKYHYERSVTATENNSSEVATPIVPAKEIPKDVSQDKSLTLWQQLTNRYLQTHDRFLPKKKIDP